MGKVAKYLWLGVTPDEYEFPIYIENSASKLAKKLGISSSTVLTSEYYHRSGKLVGIKIVKVKLEEGENEQC